MRRIRFSLIGLLAVVTLAAVVMSHAVTSLRLWRAKEELAQLRERLGLIDVEDPNLVAARALPSANSHEFRWIVRLPAEREFVLRVGMGALSPEGLPLAEAHLPAPIQITPDEATREAFIALRFVEGQRGYGAIRLEVPGSKSVIAVNPEIAALFARQVETTQSSIGERAAMRRADAPINLFMRRTTQLDDDRATGIVLWLEGRNAESSR